MNAPQRECSSSESDPRYANVDERKRKRMISNRESARRSRMRKQKQLADLSAEIASLQRENTRVRESIGDTSQRYIEMESANNVLRARVMELTDRLRSVNSVLQIVELVDGADVEIPEVADPLTEPWMQPGPVLPSVQPIMASADVLNY